MIRTALKNYSKAYIKYDLIERGLMCLYSHISLKFWSVELKGFFGGDDNLVLLFILLSLLLLPS